MTPAGYMPQTFRVHDWPWLACPTCNGEGCVWVEPPGDRPDPETGEWGVTDECPECGGPGITPFDGDPLDSLLSPGIFEVHVFETYGSTRTHEPVPF